MYVWLVTVRDGLVSPRCFDKEETAKLYIEHIETRGHDSWRLQCLRVWDSERVELLIFNDEDEDEDKRQAQP
jgi:hypothetical protein